MEEMGMQLLQGTQSSEADLRVPAYILDHALSSQPDKPTLRVSARDEPAPCLHPSRGFQQEELSGQGYLDYLDTLLHCFNICQMKREKTTRPSCRDCTTWPACHCAALCLLSPKGSFLPFQILCVPHFLTHPGPLHFL